jgi:hypothetical protein
MTYYQGASSEQRNVHVCLYCRRIINHFRYDYDCETQSKSLPQYLHIDVTVLFALHTDKGTK